MRVTDCSDVDPGTFYAAAEAFANGYPVHVTLAGVPSPVLIQPVEVEDGQLIYMAMKGACVVVTNTTAFNAFELVRGGFRLDIAQRLAVLLSALSVSVNRVPDTHMAGLIEAPKEQEK